MPDVTVLLPVYNGEEYLRETMESILEQTYQDFEFLIVDDGSTDGTAGIIGSFSDPRIRVLCNASRLKLSGALNRGINEAKGNYIARMDADDVALPQRLKKQVTFMRQHPEVGICGTAIEIFGRGRARRDIYPATSEAIQAYALFDCPFCHPTVMMRRDFLLEHDLRYDGSYYPTEDYELWARAISLFPTVNLDEVLLRYRLHDHSMTGSDWDEMDRQAARIIRTLLEKLGIRYTEAELSLHRNIGRGRSCRCTFAEIDQAGNWLQKLVECNASEKQYDEAALADMLALVWYRLCFNNASLGWKIFSRFIHGSRSRRGRQQSQRTAMLFLSIIKNKMLSTRK